VDRPQRGAASRLASRRESVLRAREERDGWIASLAARLERGSLVVVSTSVPGREKYPPGLAAAFAGSLEDVFPAAACPAPIQRRTGSSGTSHGTPDSSATAPAFSSPGPRARRLEKAAAEPWTEIRCDALGPFQAWFVEQDPITCKIACTRAEPRQRLGRLLDLDVFGPGGTAVRREEVGQPARACLACAEPAWDCMAARRHAPEELRDAVERILDSALARRDRAKPQTRRATRELAGLARSLVWGARREIALTPKPGLVDRIDNGSHPDLSYSLMRRSCDLLALYLNELAEFLFLSGFVHRQGSRCQGSHPGSAASEEGEGRSEVDGDGRRRELLATAEVIGRAAEARMMAMIGSNAHRGYIFLSGLAVLSAWEAAGEGQNGWMRDPALLGERMSTWARIFFARADATAAGGGEGAGPGGAWRVPGRDGPRARSKAAVNEADACEQRPGAGDVLPGAQVRRQGVFLGIRGEVEGSLASVTRVAWPALRASVDAGEGWRTAAFRAMARLMEIVEDTTAIHRCGAAGLERIRQDGAALRKALQAGLDPVPLLAAWNEEYRRLGLTMGGVADCLALTLALERFRVAVERHEGRCRDRRGKV